MSSLNAVATAAARLHKKPSKRDVMNTLRQLIEQGALPEKHAAELYAFFLPPLPTKGKTPEQWAQLAVGEHDVRSYLNYLYSDGARLIGTDGHRLHVVPTSLSPGWYDKAAVKLDIQPGKFPDVDRVIPPKAAATKTLPADPAGWPVEDWAGMGLAYRLPTGGIVSKAYWDQAVSGSKGARYSAWAAGGGNAYRIDMPGGRLAVVMGLREPVACYARQRPQKDSAMSIETIYAINDNNKTLDIRLPADAITTAWETGRFEQYISRAKAARIRGFAHGTKKILTTRGPLSVGVEEVAPGEEVLVIHAYA